jgi:hypothetical protein
VRSVEALVAVVDHDGDLTGLAAALDDHPAGHLGEDEHAKLSHLDDLTVRLMTTGIDAARLLGDDELDKKVLAQARRKVMTQALSGRDLTGPTRHPPRRQLRERALFGNWAGVHGRPLAAVPAARRSWSRPGRISGPARPSSLYATSRRSWPGSSGTRATIRHGCWRCAGRH